MLFKDWQADGTTYAKDPCVVYFKGCAWLYYSAHGLKEIGIAVSDDYENWTIKGYIKPETEAEGHMICAPAAIVINDVLHLFYQSYGNFPRDYICHAWSEDGIVFHRDPTNPIIRPSGEWNAGRAIDADVIAFEDKLYCYWASRDPSCEIQLLGVSTAPLDSGFHAQDWTQPAPGPSCSPNFPGSRLALKPLRRWYIRARCICSTPVPTTAVRSRSTAPSATMAFTLPASAISRCRVPARRAAGTLANQAIPMCGRLRKEKSTCSIRAARIKEKTG